jgi:diaminopimelate epimerase
MKLEFTKMHGAGNDFVMIEDLKGRITLEPGKIAALCHRNLGIGADGLMLLRKPSKSEKRDHPKLDARMVYFNSDGSRAEMCGNGARCFAAFAIANGLGRRDKVRFLTDAGVITATPGELGYTIQMTPPHDIRIGERIDLASGKATVHYLNTGVPHAVKFVPDVSKVSIRTEGRELRVHPAWGPKGANANFVQIRGSGQPLLVRTYERGVEDETLACGTGVTAAAIAAHLAHGVALPIRLQVTGGDVLEVNFSTQDAPRRAKGAKAGGNTAPVVKDVTLSGPAVVVYKGSVRI